jgi:hypothetical protein
MTQSPLSRRTVLRGLGTAIALPWLEAMAPAAPLIGGLRHGTNGSKPPVRMAFLYVPNGMHMPDWKPQGPGDRDFELQSIMQPVSAFREKMNVFSGLSLRGAKALGDGGGDHARSVAAFLTGAHPRKTHGADIQNGVSVDQVAAEKIGSYTRLKSLELGRKPAPSAVAAIAVTAVSTLPIFRGAPIRLRCQKKSTRQPSSNGCLDPKMRSKTRNSWPNVNDASRAFLISFAPKRTRSAINLARKTVGSLMSTSMPCGISNDDYNRSINLISWKKASPTFRAPRAFLRNTVNMSSCCST